MSDQSEASTPRREFLGQIAASAIVLAGTACAAPAVATTTAASPAAGAPSPQPQQPASAAPTEFSSSTPPPPMNWDDSWFNKLTAKHKAVFDSPEIVQGTTLGPSHAARYLNGMREALGASGTDVQVVIVIRHSAVPFAFNDAMWAKYALGENLNIKSGQAWATKNPLANARESTRANAGAQSDRPQGNLAWFASHGHILLGCDLATQGHATLIARRVNGDVRKIHEELRANLVPGMILQPNGIYATLRAQEAGCAFMRST